MLPERVDEMLHSYREYLGRCKHLERAMEDTRRQLKALRATMVADAASPGSQRLDGLPHGTTVGRPTERLAIKFASGYEPKEVLELETLLSEQKREYSEKYAVVLFVDAWLTGLTERERWLIENQVIDGMTWRDVIHQYELHFGEPRTKDGLKKLKARAMSKIYNTAS